MADLRVTQTRQMSSMEERGMLGTQWRILERRMRDGAFVQGTSWKPTSGDGADYSASSEKMFCRDLKILGKGVFVALPSGRYI